MANPLGGNVLGALDKSFHPVVFDIAGIAGAGCSKCVVDNQFKIFLTLDLLGDKPLTRPSPQKVRVRGAGVQLCLVATAHVFCFELCRRFLEDEFSLDVGLSAAKSANLCRFIERAGDSRDLVEDRFRDFSKAGKVFHCSLLSAGLFTCRVSLNVIRRRTILG